MKTFWRRASLPLALTLGMFAAGCGDDNNDTTTPDNPAPQQPATPAPTNPSPEPSPSVAPQPPVIVPGDVVVFIGRVKAIDFPTMRVDGQVVQLQDTTQFVRGNQGIGLNDIEIGQTVRVHGRLMLDHTTILAEKIAIEKPSK
jgi:hypothetical protein